MRLVSFLAVLGLLGGAAYAGREAITNTIRDVQDNLWGAEVHAQRMIASSEAPGRAAALTIDGNGMKSWSAAVPGNTADEYLEAEFEKPIRLLYMFISGGPSNNAEVFRTERRPTKMEIVTYGRENEQISLTGIELQDVSTAQRFYVSADEVSKIKIRILESTGPAEASVSVAEVQFWGR
ncbi:MAG: hypothetical protein ABWY04_15270 [Arthrobacter sp.]